MDFYFKLLVMAFMVVGLTFLLISIDFISKYYELIIETKKKKVYTDYNESIESINGLKDLIDKSISIKVAHLFSKEITLQKNYNVLNLDSDVSKVANEVYKEFNPEIFTNMKKTTKIYNDDFWLKYIIQKTTVSILDVVSTINLSKE